MQEQQIARFHMGISNLAVAARTLRGKEVKEVTNELKQAKEAEEGRWLRNIK